jgi:2'-5' RNA ligase
MPSYASTQIQLPDEIAQKLSAIGGTIPKDDLAEDGLETDPHVTVKYGLTGDDLATVKEALASEMPVRFTMGMLQIFRATDERNSDVLVADVYSDDLRRLNQEISNAVPHIDTHPNYQPHATIAYLKPGKGEAYAYRDDLQNLEGVADEVVHSGRDGKRTVIPLTAESRKNKPIMFAAGASSYVLNLDGSDGGTALPLGLEGFPTQNDAGEPIHYRRMKIATCGQWTHRGSGEQFEITKERADEWAKNTAAISASGFMPFIPGEHRDTFNAADNHGYVVRVNRDGDDVYADVALHGDDALKIAARNGRSIYIKRDMMDAKGNVYKGEALGHLALVPNPALPDLGGTVQIAASADRPAISVPVFTLAAANPLQKESDMTKELAQKFRTELGVAADVPDEKLADLAATKALALSADVKTLTTERNTLKTERDAKAQEVLALSADNKEPDALSMSLICKTFKNEREQTIASGAISQAGMDALDTLYFNAGKPTKAALALSAGSVEPHYSRLLEIIRKNPGIKTDNAVQRDDTARDNVQLALSGDKPKEGQQPDRQAQLMREQTGAKS